MGFNFNPSLWFVCRLCRRLFASTEALKEHKLQCHLGECMGIKCIIFEERLLNEEWVSENNSYEDEIPKSNTKLVNCSSIKDLECNVHCDYDPSSETMLKNPYVSLRRITNSEITSFNKNSSDYKHDAKTSPANRKLLQSSSYSKSKVTDKEPELSKQTHLKTDRGENNIESNDKIVHNEDSDHHIFVSNNSIHLEYQIQLKEKSSINDVSTPMNSVEIDDAHFNSEDVKEREFIAASFSSNSDRAPQVQFASTLLPTFPQNYQFIFNSDSDTTIAESKEQQILENEPNDFNSSSADVKICMTTYEPRLDTSPGVQNQEQEQQTAIGSIQYQDQGSTSLLNYPRTATGETVEKPFMCETCFAFFRTKSSLKLHLVCHSSSKPFKCSKCPSRFKRKLDLTRHQIVHGMETNFKCRFCNKSCTKYHKLLDHERTHTGDKPFKCLVAYCDYSACSKCALDQHIRGKHSEELGLQQFVCPTCGKTYGLRNKLNEHIRSTHSHSATTPFQFSMYPPGMF